MQIDVVNTWLGPFADETTDEQKEALSTAFDMIEERWPESDDPRFNDFGEDREAASNAAAEVILESTQPSEIGDEFAQARRRLAEKVDRLAGAVIAVRILDPTVSEVKLAELFGVSRPTIRKALGKPAGTKVTRD